MLATCVMVENRQCKRSILPNVEPFVLPDAGHLLHLENPRGLAQGLANFFARHPIGALN